MSFLISNYVKIGLIIHSFDTNSYFTASKGSNFYILFAITAAGVVPCGGPKKSPCTLNIISFGPLGSVYIKEYSEY